jgi:hypothetical protein
MRFFDVYWYVEDPTAGELRAHKEKVDETVYARAAQHPSLLELEVQCPRRQGNAPIADFTGSVRRAICPLCRQTLKAEAGHLVKALYVRAGLGSIE